jgi:peptidoglycan/LPS O-acetylase OafA/YrhL
MLFAFVPGIALAALELRVPAWIRAHGRGLAIALLPASLACFVAYAATDVGSNAARAFLAAAGAGALVAAPLVRQWSRGNAWRALDNGTMDWLGARSYSIYLVHYAIGLELVSLAREAGSAWAAFGITLGLDLVLSLIAAALVFRFVERPFLRLRSGRRPRFAAASSDPAPAEPATATETAR